MDISALCISPIVVGIILLLLEYFVIQPTQNARDVAVLKSSPKVGPVWASAISTGVKHFRSYQSNPAFPLNNERVKIEDVDIAGNKATLVVTISPRTSLVLLVAMVYSFLRIQGWTVHMTSRYQLIIDRGGDILAVKKLDETTMYDATSRDGHSPSSRSDELIIKQVHEPVTKATPDGTEVTVSFDVENRGKGKKVHPEVHYKVAQLVNGIFEEHDVYSPTDWTIELEPNTVHPVAFTRMFGPNNIIVLTKPPHKVSVKLIPIRA